MMARELRAFKEDSRFQEGLKKQVPHSTALLNKFTLTIFKKVEIFEQSGGWLLKFKKINLRTSVWAKIQGLWKFYKIGPAAFVLALGLHYNNEENLVYTDRHFLKSLFWVQRP